jgi:hypothetical protein
LTVLIDPSKKSAFEGLCARQDVTPSQVVRRLIRDYLAAHEVDFTPSGTEKTFLDRKKQSRAVRLKSKT